MKLFTASLRLAALAFLLLGAVDTVVAAGLAQSDASGLVQRRDSRAGRDVQQLAAPGSTAGEESSGAGSESDEDELAQQQKKEEVGKLGMIARTHEVIRAYLASENKTGRFFAGLGKVVFYPLVKTEKLVRYVGAGCYSRCPRRVVAGCDRSASAIAAQYAKIEAWMGGYPTLAAIADNAYDYTTRAAYITVMAYLITNYSATECTALLTLSPSDFAAAVLPCLSAATTSVTSKVTALVTVTLALVPEMPAGVRNAFTQYFYATDAASNATESNEAV